MRLQNRRVPGVTGLVLGAALVLAGCGAGQITQTATQQPAVDGAQAYAGQLGSGLAIRNAALAFPPNGQAYAVGSAAPLSLTIVNDAATDDELLSVTSDAATGSVIEGSRLVVAGHSLVIAPSAGGSSAVQTTSAPSTSASSPTSTSSSKKSSETTTSSDSAQAPTTTSAAPDLAPGKGSVTLQGIKQPVWPGMTIKVTFIFKNAGPVAVDMPIVADPNASADRR